MKFSEETLMAYADNELDAQTRSAVEAAMATDPEVARRVAKHKALRGKLRAAFDEVLDEPPPQRLVDTARGAPAARREGNVIPLRRKASAQRAWQQWAGLAASLIAGVLIGQVLWRNQGSGPIITRGGQLFASGVLASALSAQLASAPSEDSPVRVAVSFKSKTGEYCRTFTLRETAPLAGLACRDHADWRVAVLAQDAAAQESAGPYRQAATPLPRPVLQAVDDSIAGEPLDAHAEAAARDRDWNP